ncbi:MAG: prepilin-type N-terminal cleavage/methylation domain-containing protein [Burkholderiaceae bacterium]|jgi:type IV pilus assembly protein PilW|nr:prepilin-type N-terminal cleavage/methylation domain-containing protein [Burkholderiaceae bacterium]
MIREPLSHARRTQRGMSLIELMVGLAIGLLVVLAAVASLTVARNISRSVGDSAALEQQATLVMLQIGQQISQAGSVNAYLAGTDPNAGILNDGSVTTINVGGNTGKVNFDTRDAGVSASRAKVSVFGTDGGTTGSDTFSISYIWPNDGSPTGNCTNTTKAPTLANGAPRVVSSFSVDGNNQLLCGDGQNTPQPMAANVLDMRVKYLSVNGSGTVTYQTAANVADWSSVAAVEVCLEMQGDIIQAPQQTNVPNCRDETTRTIGDGRLHRIVRRMFYLRN